MMMAQQSNDTDYTLLPLTFKCITGGDLSIRNDNATYDRNFEYSVNDGAWTAFSLPASSGVLLITTLSPGDTIRFRRDNENFANVGFSSSSSLTFDIYGNILSLQYGSNFNGQTSLRNTSKQSFGGTFGFTNVVDASNLVLAATTLSNGCYNGMFMGCKRLTKAPELPATTATSQCYYRMFKQCTSLVSAPELPATTLAASCYYEMFSDCSNLINPPTVLPAAVLADSCYLGLFNNCQSLTTYPTISATTLAKDCFKAMLKKTAISTAPSLPYTTLKSGCYETMFLECNNLTETPELPATVLEKNCYKGMFKGCANLVSIRELRATTLAESCYQSMFESCNNINNIKCLATDISASNCTLDWLKNVSNSGTFVKASGVTWPSGGSGIPNGWTVTEE
jgi:hypothetical protein